MALPFEVTILGVNSAVPVFGRHPSSQIVRYDDTLLMIDCGEGTQAQLSRYKIKRSKIGHVLISHLHGDHCFGLPGLITTSSLNRRKAPLTIHGPVGLKKYIDTVLEISGSNVTYELHILEYDTNLINKIDIEDKRLTISTFPLQHRIPTMGYKIKEEELSFNINTAKIAEYSLSIEEIKLIKAGSDLVKNEKVVPNKELVISSHKHRAYAYVSDTLYDPTIVPNITGATTVYHETTYLDDMKELAKDRMHTTIGGAVEIAQKAGADQVITGHYSSRYKDITVFLDAGRQLWEGVQLGEEGKVYSI